MTFEIWCACALIVVVIIGLAKRVETRMLLFLVGLVMCIIAGKPLSAFQAFVKGMTNPTLVPAICLLLR